MCYKYILIHRIYQDRSIKLSRKNNVAMSAAMNFHPRNLGDLPDELLQQICSLLPSQGDLAALCLVSQRINSIADPLLHHSIFFDEPKHHVTFAQSLSTRPRRGSLIQNVRVEYPSHELAEFMHWKDGSYRIDHFSHSISTMSNLENLVVSVPVELLQGIGTLFNGPFDLACLKSCELPPHLHFWFDTDIMKALSIINVKMMAIGTSKKTSTSSPTPVSSISPSNAPSLMNAVSTPWKNPGTQRSRLSIL